ncbi:hypothetical protein D3C71_2017320 [compost metagenome]
MLSVLLGESDTIGQLVTITTGEVEQEAKVLRIDTFLSDVLEVLVVPVRSVGRLNPIQWVMLFDGDVAKDLSRH